MLDLLILMEIYPAREEPIPGVSASMIFDRVDLKEKVLVSRKQLLRVVREQDPTLLVTMGAGDINQFVAPLTEGVDEKKMISRILKILVWFLIAAWFVVIMGFVSGEADKVLCNRIEVIMSDTVHNRFVTRTDIRTQLEETDIHLQGYPLTEINIRSLERTIEKDPYIGNAEVSKDISGRLEIRVERSDASSFRAVHPFDPSGLGQYSIS